MKLTNVLKTVGVASAFIFAAGSLNAQTTGADITKQAATTLGSSTSAAGNDGGSVRVIDNKGTIKYLQVQNGITQMTNTTPAGGIVTTWQLGGALNDDTYIDANGSVFAIDGIKLITTETVSTDATTESDHGTGTGYTFLVRDEATGETKKLLASDLVKGGTTNNTATAATDFTYTDATVPNDITKIWVYRNGAKLLGGVDYTIAGAIGAVEVTVKAASGTDPEDYVFITGDRIEIQWIR